MKNNQHQTPLYDALIAYAKRNDIVPFDVPGHKLGKGIPKRFKDDVGETIFKMDVNSMKELDSLSNPINVIKESEALAAEFFHADHAFFLVNGSTSGVQNMILSSVNDGEKIILPRNIHKSAFNGLILNGARPVYMEPFIDEASGISMGVPLETVKQTIDAHPDAKAILLLHPTYFGYTSRLEDIIAYAHEHEMAVLVDQSHGSHFSLHDTFPKSAMEYGADMATISMHKTGGSLTQSSILLHKNGMIPYSKIRTTINLQQTSSASYLLLSSLDIARHYLAENGSKLFTEMITIAEYAKANLNALEGLTVVGSDRLDGDSMNTHDITKLVIDVSAYGVTGFHVYDYFKTTYNSQLELGETHIVLAVISLGDTMQSIQKLIDAFTDFTKTHTIKDKKHIKTIPITIPEMIYTPRIAFFKPSMLMKLEQSIGMIAADSIMVYPPGIPLVVTGEKISQDTINNYKYLDQEDNILIGAHQKHDAIYIKVIKP
ncbi:MAG: aminotransferase class I/II-fold pyridoxal phosphate-dependent enzyme [Bacillota bacterium]